MSRIDVLVLESLDLTYSQAVDIVNANIPVVDMTWIWVTWAVYIFGILVLGYKLNTCNGVHEEDWFCILCAWMLLGLLISLAYSDIMYTNAYMDQLYNMNETAYMLVESTYLF